MRVSSGKGCIIRIIAIINILCFITLIFAGCGDTGVSNNPYRKVNAIALETQILASNNNFELSWDSEANAVLLKSLKNGKIWSDILYDAYLDGSLSANANSGILINVADTQSLKLTTIRSYSEIPENGNIVCKKIENGIRVTYFFHTYEIAVPVDYQLRDDSVLVSVNTAQILETGKDYKLLSISLAPYMCSVKNDAENGYLFVPSGSGAIMYAAENSEGIREFKGEVYGKDATRQIPRDLNEEEEIRLPVFGAVDKDTAIMGIIEEGAGAAEIEAHAGNNKLGYSNINVNFYVRGYDEFISDKDIAEKTVTNRISDEISGQTLTAVYYPLLDDNAGYQAMAEKYREYLIENEKLTESVENNVSPYSVTFLGGSNITKSILGIPNKSTVALTTFAQIQKILYELENKNGILPEVRLLGFGDGGIHPGTAAGGKKYLSVCGNKNELSSLQEFCHDKKIALFFDSDIVFFAKSGNGIYKNLDSALTAINRRITHYDVSPIRIQDKNSGYSVISREKLKKSADIVLKKAKKYDNTAVSLSSIGSTAFSDNVDKKYVTKNGIENDVSEIIKEFKENKIKVAVASANSYAACAADMIFDVTSTNGEYFVFDQSVPFYQMVFHGSKPMYTEALNLKANNKTGLSQAVAYGMGLGYTLIGEFVPESDDLDTYDLYGMVYEDNVDSIVKNLNSYNEIYSATCDAKMTNYEILPQGITKTTYSNGKVVYVNHTANDVEYSSGILKAFEFTME